MSMMKEKVKGDVRRYEEMKKTDKGIKKRLRNRRLMVVSEEGMQQNGMNTNVNFPCLRRPSTHCSNDVGGSSKSSEMSSTTCAHGGASEIFRKEKTKTRHEEGTRGNSTFLCEPEGR
jgi:hypothetical protein